MPGVPWGLPWASTSEVQQPPASGDTCKQGMPTRGGGGKVGDILGLDILSLTGSSLSLHEKQTRLRYPPGDTCEFQAVIISPDTDLV